ncbi:hypothetical protein GCM10027521_28330 [Amycolatopsis cihanbeyliensis]
MGLDTAFLFAGQGSQYHHMGRWLYDNDRTFRAVLDDLDSVVRERRGDSVLEHVYSERRGIEEPFEEFRFSQPGVFMFEYALARMLRERGFRPDVVLGTSLGEVAAAVEAGMAEPADCLAMLLRQVDLFERHCPRGGMLAVLTGPELLENDRLVREHSQLAAINSESNIVLAGREDELDHIADHLSTQGILYQRLPVPFAFHSTHIEPIEDRFRELAGSVALRPARLPLLSGTTGEVVEEMTVDHLWRVLRDPFDLRAALNRLLERDRYLLLDLGPSGSMANLVRLLLPAGARSKTFPLLSPFAAGGTLLDAVLEQRPARTEPARTEKERPMNQATMRACAFPGQGSQTKGMGKELFDTFDELTARADEILGYSIRELCVEDPERNLKQTEYTQPALYVVSALSYLAWLREGQRLPDYVLGHSLGEYVALFAAGAFDFETGLRLVHRRGELMSRASGGTMAAVSGFDAERVRELLAEHGLDTLDVANINTPTQTVIAGPKEDITRAAAVFTEREGRCAPLNVSAPFHSRYMTEAAEEFGRFLDQFTFATPKIPVISNVDARPYTADSVAENLRRQIVSPVRWVDSIRYLMSHGEFDLREIGPGTVLTKLVAKIRSEADPLPAEPEPVPEPAAPQPVRPARAPVTPAGPDSLGSADFRADHGVRYAYVAGGMYRQVSGVDLVARMAGAGVLAYYGSSGLTPDELATGLRELRERLGGVDPFGVNLTYDPFGSATEERIVDLLLDNDIRRVEVSTYVQLTPALVRYRLRGAGVRPGGLAVAGNKVLAKVTRPDVARLFLEPPPPELVRRLREQGRITAQEAEAAARLPMADDVCAVGDSGGYTDMGVLPALLPSVLRLRDDLAKERPELPAVRVGAGGGIGTPEAAAAAFVLGAEFVLTGSVNLCTAESALSAEVKDLLQDVDVHDTTLAPFGDLFELGGKARVLKKGTLFHARASKLYDLWRNHDDWLDIDPEVRARVEQRYFRCTFDELERRARAGTGDGERPDPKRRMALVFRAYCAEALRLACEGPAGRETDVQIACGPALGACNQWLRGSGFESWRGRHAEELAGWIMAGAAEIVHAGRRRP